ncbi:hypothetical protein D3C72_2006130 [compost metagenome]
MTKAVAGARRGDQLRQITHGVVIVRRTAAIWQSDPACPACCIVAIQRGLTQGIGHLRYLARAIAAIGVILPFGGTGGLVIGVGVDFLQ